MHLRFPGPFEFRHSHVFDSFDHNTGPSGTWSQICAQVRANCKHRIARNLGQVTGDRSSHSASRLPRRKHSGRLIWGSTWILAKVRRIFGFRGSSQKGEEYEGLA